MNSASNESGMKYPKLGVSGLRVSQICLGASQFGARVDEATARRITGSAFDAGVNFIDTADSSESYGNEGSERVVGKVISGKRDDWILATKVHNRIGTGPQNSSLGRRWLMRAIDESLERLKTDHVDIWYFHNDDRDTPLEEALRAVGDIIRSGKVATSA